MKNKTVFAKFFQKNYKKPAQSRFSDLVEIATLLFNNQLFSQSAIFRIHHPNRLHDQNRAHRQYCGKYIPEQQA
ncbi:hypothetical protein [Arcanobacterium hippocoleae]|uniref:hypothetical protein n=1 Tax=Arcanobacterium hippocoleae TaxID=149017 RepID=UPI00333FB756